MKLDEYLQFAWTPVLKKLPEGDWSLTIPPLDDFEMFGPKKQLEAEWKQALRGHLRAYLDNQKQIPIPRYSVEERVADSPRASGQVFFANGSLTDMREIAKTVAA